MSFNTPGKLIEECNKPNNIQHIVVTPEVYNVLGDGEKVDSENIDTMTPVAETQLQTPNNFAFQENDKELSTFSPPLKQQNQDLGGSTEIVSQVHQTLFPSFYPTKPIQNVQPTPLAITTSGPTNSTVSTSTPVLPKQSFEYAASFISKSLPPKKNKTRKECLHSGKQHINTKGKLVEEKRYKHVECNCRLECSKKIGAAERETIFKLFWALGNWHSQTVFIVNNVKLLGIQRRTTTNPKKRNFHRKFFLNGKLVCKETFLSTLGISNKRLDYALRVKNEDGRVAPDRRGGNPQKRHEYPPPPPPQIIDTTYGCQMNNQFSSTEINYVNNEYFPKKKKKPSQRKKLKEMQKPEMPPKQPEQVACAPPATVPSGAPIEHSLFSPFFPLPHGQNIPPPSSNMISLSSMYPGQGFHYNTPPTSIHSGQATHYSAPPIHPGQNAHYPSPPIQSGLPTHYSNTSSLHSDQNSQYSTPPSVHSVQSPPPPTEVVPPPKNSPSKKLSRKERLQAGKQHVNTRGNVVEEKKYKHNECNCRLDCSKNINAAERESLFQLFWALGNWHSQTVFIVSNVQILDVQRRTTKKPNSQKRRDYHRKYFLNDKLVCKETFLSTLGISNTRLDYALRVKNKNGHVDPDRRGGHPPNKTSQATLDCIFDFLNQFPKFTPHCSLAHKQYFHPELTVKKLHELYIQRIKERNQAQLGVCYKIFLKIFRSFNVSIYVPKKDMCQLCDKYKNQLQPTTRPEHPLTLHNNYACKEQNDQRKSYRIL